MNASQRTVETLAAVAELIDMETIHVSADRAAARESPEADEHGLIHVSPDIQIRLDAPAAGESLSVTAITIFDRLPEGL